MAKTAEKIERLLAVIAEKPVSAHQIVCATKLHRVTVMRYLFLIERIQKGPKVKRETIGLRTLFKIE